MRYEVEFAIENNFYFEVEATSEEEAEDKAELLAKQELAKMLPRDFDLETVTVWPVGEGE